MSNTFGHTSGIIISKARDLIQTWPGRHSFKAQLPSVVDTLLFRKTARVRRKPDSENSHNVCMVTTEILSEDLSVWSVVLCKDVTLLFLKTALIQQQCSRFTLFWRLNAFHWLIAVRSVDNRYISHPLIQQWSRYFYQHNVH